MSIEVQKTAIPEVKIIRANRFYDDRGFFAETYRELQFSELGLPKFIQDNVSKSKKGVIRGMHWQASPFSQGKLVSCLSGKILDIALDIRRESATFGKHVAVELSEDDTTWLWVPEGFAHGFQALEEDTLVLYKVSNSWNKQSERSVNPLDCNLMLPWPISDLQLSEKDQDADSFTALQN
jgi:dTDP-4-dehydrorhamnose 3,5-epimerase